MSDASPATRVSDSEREATVTRLRDAAGEGRLDPEELSERVEAAYAARTDAELAALLVDLPQPPAPPRTQTPEHRQERSQQMRNRTAAFLTPNLICIIVWAAAGAGYFWPVWVLMGTGIGYVSYMVRYVLGAEQHEHRHRGHRGHGHGH